MGITACLLGGILATTLAPASCVEPAGRFSVDSELVTIPLSVTDRTGRAVPGLDRTDFTIAEDGAPQTVLAVSRWDAPISFGVVFDTSGSMGGAIRLAQHSISALFHESEPEDESFLIQFADAPRLETGFVRDLHEISRRLLLCSARGATALFDAVYAGLDLMTHASNLHKALVVVSDGGDNHSRRSFTELRSAARERDVQIFVLSIRRDPRDLDERRGSAELDDLANDTGGRLVEVNRDDEIPRAIAVIGELIRTQYLLFYRPLQSPLDGKWRRVRVGVGAESKKPSYRIRSSRSGYYSPQSLCATSTAALRDVTR
jgi:Ca-activated chloride channel family protein